MLKIFFTLLVVSNSVFGQSITVPLKKLFNGENISSYINPTSRPILDKSQYTGIDTAKYTVYEIFEISFNSEQSMAEKGIKKEYFATYGIDTNCISYQPIEKNKFAILTAFDNRGLKHIIVDANNNKNLGDDKEYIFDLTQDKIYPQVFVDIEYFDGTKINKAIVPYIIDAYTESLYAINNLGKKLSVTLLLKYEQRGEYCIDNKLYRFRIKNEHINLYKNEKFLINITQIPIDSNDNNDYWYNSTYPVIIGDKSYVIDSLAENKLYLTFNDKINNGQGRLNTYAINFSGKDLLNEKPLVLNRYKGNFVLIDFWGSWCGPCIEALPELVLLRDKYEKKGIKIISLAYDKIGDKGKLERIIKENKLSWSHLLIDRSIRSSILIDYKVNKFPTTLLIDPQGKIVVRGEGGQVLKKIDLYLENIFRIKQN